MGQLKERYDYSYSNVVEPNVKNKRSHINSKVFAGVIAKPNPQPQRQALSIVGIDQFSKHRNHKIEYFEFQKRDPQTEDKGMRLWWIASDSTKEYKTIELEPEEDIIASTLKLIFELDSIDDPNIILYRSPQKSYTVKELVTEIKNQTQDGKKFIRSWLNAQSKMKNL